jgi:glycerol uptake facilitator-like aquaporin
VNSRAVFSEALGALLLTACVVGSGIMAERLAGGSTAIALLGNTLATVFVLAALIATLGPIGGAHFNPAITLVAWRSGRVSGSLGAAYVVAQIVGCCAGAVLANAMFDAPLVQVSQRIREGGAQWLSEVIATAGLVFIAFRARNFDEAAWRVPLWIGAAYWFTASTSFANPAITLGRCLSDSFAGIRPADVPEFIAAQLVGAGVGVLLLRALREPVTP